MTIAAAIWEPEERAAWTPPEAMPPSRWAERHRRLGRDQSSRPGPWRNEAAPYLAGLMDLAARPGVARLDVMKAAQMGVSEMTRCLLGYWALTDPDPVGLTLPVEKKGRQIVADRVLPLFRETPALAALVGDRKHDLKAGHLTLANGWRLFLMWSGSPTSMASDPMRRVVNDEVDKFVEWIGEESDPVSLTLQRMASYAGRELQINISTPTTRFGRIAQLVEEDDVRLDYVVPCPRCGRFQRLVFPQLKWSKWDEKDPKKLAARVVRERAVWYECVHCGGKIRPDERDAMVRAGRWSSDDGLIEDAAALERWPEGTRIGVRMSRLICLWWPWWRMAAEWIRSEGRLGELMAFYTQTLGLPFEQRVTAVKADLLGRLAASAPLAEGIVPQWAAAVLATIDTQADHFYVVVRAWGPGMRSARVWHGLLDTFADLDRLLAQPWPVDGGQAAPMPIQFALIDSGGTAGPGDAPDRATRPMEVYRWVLARRSRVRAIKGAARPRENQWYWRTKGLLDEDGRAGRRGAASRAVQVPLWMVDSQHFQDELSEHVALGESEGEERRWFLNRREDPEYDQHLSAMHKVVVRRGHRLDWRWIEKTPGLRHDYRDCEVYQIAAAYMARIHLLPALEDFMASREAERRADSAPAPKRERKDPWTPTPFRL